MKKALIFGATSKIAQSFCELLLKDGFELHLLGRNISRLEILMKHYQSIGFDQKIEISQYDIEEHKSKNIEADLFQKQFFHLVFYAHGILVDQNEVDFDQTVLEKIMDINFLSITRSINRIVPFYQKNKKGHFMVITSVAGDRGRASNYYYGISKGALSIFLEGLRGRLFIDNIHVTDIRPGFVDTPMTKNFKKGILWASSDKVGKDIFKAYQNKRDLLYTPFFWKWIMCIIKLIPPSVFKKLKI